MRRKASDVSRIVSVRLPDDLVQRLDRLLDWCSTHQRLPSTRNAALREALSVWLDQQEQQQPLLDPHTLQRQFQATYQSLRQQHDGVPIAQLRQRLQWPRERFDAVLEALRAEQHIDLEVLQDHEGETQATHDSYHVNGQCYGRLRWRV
jgi:hypothetical protein